jgi:TetR/AcrR family transcriptional regulator
MKRKSLKATGGGQRRRPVSEAARQAILKAAAQEFAAAGFGGARAQRIAARAGVNKALPFYHFGSKADLYDEVMRQVWEALGRVLTVHATSPADADTRLRDLLHNLVQFAARDPDNLRLLVRELIDDRARARETARTHFIPLLTKLCEIIEARIAQGIIVEVAPVQVVITLLAEVLFYFLIAPVLEDAGLSHPLSASALEAREQVVRRLIARGYRAPGAPPIEV